MAIFESAKLSRGEGPVTSSGVLKASSATEDDEDLDENAPGDVDGASINLYEIPENLLSVV